MMFFIYAIPVLSLALVAWAVASRRLSDGPRRASMVAAILLACGVWTLVRTDGITGDGDREFALAVDADSRGTAPGPGRRRAGGARAGALRRLRQPAESSEAASRGGRRADSAGAARGPGRRQRSRPPLRQQRRREPTGPAFADPSATASFAACGSRPTGRRRRRSSCGAGRSDRAGRPSRSAATSSTRRSSAATTRSSPATT